MSRNVIESARSWLRRATMSARTFTLRGCGRSSTTDPYFWISFAWARQCGATFPVELTFLIATAIIHLGFFYFQLSDAEGSRSVSRLFDLNIRGDRHTGAQGVVAVLLLVIREIDTNRNAL